MSVLKGACIVGQSGGPTSVINASAQGVTETALANENITRVLAAENGILGILEVTDILVAILVAQEFDNPVLYDSLRVHFWFHMAHTRRVLPVMSSCIIPCLIRARFDTASLLFSTSKSEVERKRTISFCCARGGMAIIVLLKASLDKL